jgi:YbbR domain-containing protein
MTVAQSPRRPPPHTIRHRAWETAGVVGLGLLSLGVAVVLWVVVRNNQNPEQRIFLQVRLEGDPIPSNYQATRYTPEAVQVTVIGPRNQIRDLKADQLSARVDISGFQGAPDGQQELEVEGRIGITVKGNDKVRGVPEVTSAKVQLERQERREVRIQPKAAGAPPVGFESEGITAEEAIALVTGTRGNLNAVDSVVAEISLDGQTVSFSKHVPLQARDRDGRTVGGVAVQPQNVTVTVRLKQNFYPRQVVVNITPRGRPKIGYTVTAVRAEPQMVTVFGPIDQINALAGISTDAIDIEGADRDVTRPVKLQLPPGVTASQQNVIASVSLRAERSSGSLGVVPRVINVGPGLTAQLITPIVALNISGPLGDVAQLRSDAVAVTVDVAGLGPGTHKIEPKLVLGPTVQLDSIVPDKVEVVISPSR